MTGSHLVHVTVNKLNGKTYINLINVAGEHTIQSAIAYDQVPPLIDLKFRIKTPQKPSRIVLQPEGKEMEFSHVNGQSAVLIPTLEIHSILEVIQ